MPVPKQYQIRGLWQAAVFRTYPCATRATRAGRWRVARLARLAHGYPCELSELSGLRVFPDYLEKR